MAQKWEVGQQRHTRPLGTCGQRLCPPLLLLVISVDIQLHSVFTRDTKMQVLSSLKSLKLAGVFMLSMYFKYWASNSQLLSDVATSSSPVHCFCYSSPGREWPRPSFFFIFLCAVEWSGKQLRASRSRGEQNDLNRLSPGCRSWSSDNICPKLNLSQLPHVAPLSVLWVFE